MLEQIKDYSAIRNKIKIFLKQIFMHDRYVVKLEGESPLMAKEKTKGIDRLALFFKGNEKELTVEKLHAGEILWRVRVEKRLWPKLEEKQ